MPHLLHMRVIFVYKLIWINFLLTFPKKNPAGSFLEQRAKSNEERAKNSEQRVKSFTSKLLNSLKVVLIQPPKLS